MTCSTPSQPAAHDPQSIAHERRVQAAWFDYLASTQDAPRRAYDEYEAAAWERLQRRLARNEQRWAATRAHFDAAAASAR